MDIYGVDNCSTFGYADNLNGYIQKLKREVSKKFKKRHKVSFINLISKGNKYE